MFSLFRSGGIWVINQSLILFAEGKTTFYALSFTKSMLLFNYLSAKKLWQSDSAYDLIITHLSGSWARSQRQRLLVNKCCNCTPRLLTHSSASICAYFGLLKPSICGTKMQKTFSIRKISKSHRLRQRPAIAKSVAHKYCIFFLPDLRFFCEKI